MSPRKTPLNVALIGQQFMGRAHSNAWRQVGRFFERPLEPVLHTVAGKNPRTIGGFARRWGWQQHTHHWQDIAVDTAVQLVDIVTPNHLHKEQALTMLAAGKHVACEKPLAGTLDDARAMRDAARRSRRGRTFVWFNYRRCPAVALAWQLVQEGRLGEIHHVRATYLQSWGGPGTPHSWRFQRKLAGSGAHGDLNAHIVDMARFLTGDEIEVVHGATSRTFVKQRKLHGGGKARSDVDDCLLFLAGFKGGAVASFEASRAATGHLNRNTMEINGSKGSLRFDFEDMNVLQLFEAKDGGRTDGWRRIMCTDESHPYAGSWWPDAHVLGYEHGFVNMAADILAVLAGGRPELPLADFADAYETQRVLEAALQAVASRAAVKLSGVR